MKRKKKQIGRVSSFSDYDQRFAAKIDKLF